MHTCSKTYSNMPAAHRQHNHDGHCALIHGHNWSFEIEFSSERLDENGFVIDFGKLKFIKTWLEDKFDHTLLLNEDDPWLEYFMQKVATVDDSPLGLESGPACLAKIVVVENCGAEKLAEWVGKEVSKLLPEGVWVSQCICYEDSKNKATWKHDA